MKLYEIKTQTSEVPGIFRSYRTTAKSFDTALSKAKAKCSKKLNETVVSVNYEGELEK